MTTAPDSPSEKHPQPENDAQAPKAAAPSEENAETPPPPSPETDTPPPKRRILIGSQRNPAAYRLASAPGSEKPGEEAAPESAVFSEEKRPSPAKTDAAPDESASDEVEIQGHFPPPNIRSRLSQDLQDDFEDAFDGVSLEELMGGESAATRQEGFEPDTKLTGRVLKLRREDVFVDLGGREQGVIPLKLFEENPEEGSEIDVIIVRFNNEEGLYELTRPGSATSVADWSQIEDGMLVEAVITGHNTGGLECEVSHIRGFIPISQIATYRVEGIEVFVGEKFLCLVTEANPERRNLVLSRRAVIEREQEEARKKLLESLEPGQTFEGVVRKLMDFGAFVELDAGVDGLLHISELAWSRVNHPSDVLTEGQRITVKIKSYDPETDRISLAYRETLANPWDDAPAKYPEGQAVKVKVVKIMEFGAFAELEPGVEGLIHISELAHRRVNRVSEIVSEGDEVDVMVLSVDTEQRRIGLSMKQMTAEPVYESEESAAGDEEPVKKVKKFTGPLKGGTGGSSGGEKFGLKW